MPSCDCYNWEHNHWPCRHFCAILKHHSDWGWSSLPKDYTNTPFLTLDEGLVDSQVSEVAGDGTGNAKETAGSQFETEQLDTCIGLTSSQVRKSTKSAHSVAAHCRERLQNVINLTYCYENAN